MSNIIRLNETAPKDEWIVMSNQGTDCFLDLLIAAAESLEKTDHQKELISFLRDRKSINDIAPGTAGFDLNEMPWQESSLREDAGFLVCVTEEAQRESVFKKLPYEADKDIILPWLQRFVSLISRMTTEDLYFKPETGKAKSISERVQNYIDNNSFCSEYLFKDWEPFLDLLYADGGRISSILWWDYCTEKQLRESVGSGGYRDPDNDGFIYAETQLYKGNLETYTLDEIKEYIYQERKTGFQYGNRYKSHELVPSFYLPE